MLGSGTGELVVPTNVVLLHPVPSKPTQRWIARPEIFAAVAFVTVKLRVVGNCACPPLVLKADVNPVNPPNALPLKSLAVTPLRLKVVKALLDAVPPKKANVGPWVAIA